MEGDGAGGSELLACDAHWAMQRWEWMRQRCTVGDSLASLRRVTLFQTLPRGVQVQVMRVMPQANWELRTQSSVQKKRCSSQVASEEDEESVWWVQQKRQQRGSREHQWEELQERDVDGGGVSAGAEVADMEDAITLTEEQKVWQQEIVACAGQGLVARWKALLQCRDVTGVQLRMLLHPILVGGDGEREEWSLEPSSISDEDLRTMVNALQGSSSSAVWHSAVCALILRPMILGLRKPATRLVQSLISTLFDVDTSTTVHSLLVPILNAGPDGFGSSQCELLLRLCKEKDIASTPWLSTLLTSFLQETDSPLGDAGLQFLHTALSSSKQPVSSLHGAPFSCLVSRLVTSTPLHQGTQALKLPKLLQLLMTRYPQQCQLHSEALQSCLEGNTSFLRRAVEKQLLSLTR